MSLHNWCCLDCNSLAISIGIGAYFAYSRWYLKKDVTHVKFSTLI